MRGGLHLEISPDFPEPRGNLRSPGFNFEDSILHFLVHRLQLTQYRVSTSAGQQEAIGLREVHEMLMQNETMRGGAITPKILNWVPITHTRSASPALN